MCNPNADMDEPLITALRGSGALARSDLNVLEFIRSFPAEADPNPPVLVGYKKRRVHDEDIYTPIYRLQSTAVCEEDELEK